MTWIDGLISGHYHQHLCCVEKKEQCLIRNHGFDQRHEHEIASIHENPDERERERKKETDGNEDYSIY